MTRSETVKYRSPGVFHTMAPRTLSSNHADLSSPSLDYKFLEDWVLWAFITTASTLCLAWCKRSGISVECLRLLRVS